MHVSHRQNVVISCEGLDRSVVVSDHGRARDKDGNVFLDSTAAILGLLISGR